MNIMEMFRTRSKTYSAEPSVGTKWQTHANRILHGEHEAAEGEMHNE